MAFNKQISDRVREALIHEKNVEEKLMFGGICYMVNGKMCMGVIGEDLMCRINPEKEQEALSHLGSRPMDFTKRPMKGYVYVNEEGIRKISDFTYWVNLCLEYNPIANASKKTKKEKSK